MCKAFVKLPRPFGDQSGGARKWAIRAGSESWFSNGVYHPPGHSVTPQPKIKAGKAKATARAKQLAIGTGPSSPEISKNDLVPYSAGPSSGPAFDGSIHPGAYPQPSYPNYLPPGYHYVPVPPSHGHHTQAGQSMYVPIWAPYAAPGVNIPPISYNRPQYQPGSQQYSAAHDFWRPPQHDHRALTEGSEHGSHGSYEGARRSPASANVSGSGSHDASPEGH